MFAQQALQVITRSHLQPNRKQFTASLRSTHLSNIFWQAVVFMLTFVFLTQVHKPPEVDLTSRTKKLMQHP
jgi:hypothetical protein